MTEDIEDIVSGRGGSSLAETARVTVGKDVRIGQKIIKKAKRKGREREREVISKEEDGKKKAEAEAPCACGGAKEKEKLEASQSGVPGTASVWVKTFGCSHNQSDSEYMSGQLQQYGYRLVEDSKEADLWLINTCTVKNPSEMAMVNIVDKGKQLEKPMVVAGCVPQGEKGIKGLESTTLLGVSQIDRVVEAVEETLQGNTVQLLAKKELPRLDLPKVRRNKHIEIIPLSTGCLGSCTYCKTKHARGELGSYDPEAIVSRAKQAALDPEVREVWLSSEDTGAYGRDIGIKLPYLLRRIVEVLPKDGRTRLRVGMTNPPFMLDSLEEIAQVLNHPLVFAYLHIPVQSGSNKVLKDMNREYTVEEFRECADTLLRLVPDLELATDIICGFPGETEEDHQETMKLVEDYKFPHCHISQFYPRTGTPAARMKRVPTKIVKQRTRELSALVDSFSNVYKPLEGTIQLVSIVEKAADKVRLVGHSNSYAQILIQENASLIGKMALVKVTKATRWSAFAELVDAPLSLDITDGYQLKESTAAAVPVPTPFPSSSSGSSQKDAANVERSGATNHWQLRLRAHSKKVGDFGRQLYSRLAQMELEYGVGSKFSSTVLLTGMGVGFAGMLYSGMRIYKR